MSGLTHHQHQCFFSFTNRDQVGNQSFWQDSDGMTLAQPPLLPGQLAISALANALGVSRGDILICKPEEAELLHYARPQNTHDASKHTQPHTKSHLSATLERERSWDPSPQHPSPPAFPISSGDKSH